MARVTAENAGPSYASVLNFRTDNSDSNKENIEDSTEVASEAKVEEEEGFVPVLGHGRRPGKGRRERERRPPPRTHKPAPHAEQPSQSQDQPQQPTDAPKNFVEAPIPKVNPWQSERRFVGRLGASTDAAVCGDTRHQTAGHTHPANSTVRSWSDEDRRPSRVRRPGGRPRPSPFACQSELVHFGAGRVPVSIPMRVLVTDYARAWHRLRGRLEEESRRR
ncbi:hypothetical protein EVAR_92811_1 [Eumeta japonica]|uniref:Uncharacterized protein n=1 Tax=Eumeta variegata TaxID=151549 RepID=A0A4C1TAS5_EUMVA|nr:hypothetical protein EVAR_92811_1 [Eumeta japonica]